MNFQARTLRVRAVAWLAVLACLAAGAGDALPGFALIPAGQFEMGDHHGFVDPKHGGDETRCTRSGSTPSTWASTPSPPAPTATS